MGAIPCSFAFCNMIILGGMRSDCERVSKLVGMNLVLSMHFLGRDGLKIIVNRLHFIVLIWERNPVLISIELNLSIIG